MILFYEIVEVVMTLVYDLAAKRFADCTWIGAMSVCRDSLGGMTHCLERLLEKALRGIHISLLTQHGVNQVAVMINGTREIAPAPMNFDIRAHRHARRGSLVHVAF